MKNNPIIINNERSVPYEKNVTIHEHKAPTDESVKLLNELQNKAIGNIIHSVEVKDNTMNAIVFYMIDDVSRWNYNYMVKFTFNGIEHKLKGTILREDLDKSSKYGSQAVVDAIAISLCYEFAKDVLKADGVLDTIKKMIR